MHIKNFASYTPKEHALLEFQGVLFLKSDCGLDWYELQPNLNPDSFKVFYNTDGVVTSFSKDASTHFPEGMSLIEVDELPDGFDADGSWKFDKDFNLIHIELVDFDFVKSSMLQKSSVAIEVIKDKLSLKFDEGLSEELQRLVEYRIAIFDAKSADELPAKII